MAAVGTVWASLKQRGVTPEIVIIGILVWGSFIYLHRATPMLTITAQDWLTGAVALPIGGRVLVADIVGWLTAIAGIPPDAPLATFLFMGVEAAAFLIASIMVPLTTLTLTGNRQAAWLAYGLFIWQAFYTFIISPRHRFWFSYDIVSLAVMSLSLYFIVTDRFRSLLLVTLIGAWNRETAALSALFYALYHWGAFPRPAALSLPVAARAALLFLGAFTVKALVWHLHGFQGGAVSFYHEPGVLRLWRNLQPWQGGVYACLGAFGFLWLLAPRALARSGNRPLGRMAWAFVPYLGGMLLVGNIDEIRIFAEFIPYLAVMLAVAWHDATKGPAGLTPRV